MKKLFHFDEHIGDWRVLVQTHDIQDGAITTRCIGDEAVRTEKIADEAVTTPKIADGAVTGEKVPDNTFGLEKFDPEFMVTERMIKDQAVTTDKIEDGAVTGEKIAPEAVTTPKIKDENVLERHLAPGAVTTDKLAPGMIEKLETLTDAEPTPNSVKPLRSGGAANVYGHYVENPEFLQVITDRNLKMLEATRKQNGNKVLYAGLEVGEGIEAGGDVEAGGSMSAGGDLEVGGDAKVGGSQTVGGDQIVMGRQEINGVVYQVVNSPEWIAVWLDGEGKVLAGFKKDGRTFIGDADFLDAIKANKEAIKTLQEQLALLNEGIDWDALKVVRYIDNPEYICVFVDGQWRVLYGVKVDGDFYFGCGVPSQIEARIQEALAEGSANGKYIDNPEYIAVWTDAEKRILFGLKQDGDFYFGYGVPSQVTAAIREAIEAERANSPMQYIDDPEERISMELDGEKKILSYRSKDGVKHEDSLEVNHLTLTGKGMTEFQQALKDAGFNPGGNGGGGDYSDVITNKGKNPVHIPTPRCAYLNILSDVNLTALSKSDRPNGVQKVNYDVKVPIEFFDGHGIYFKKWALIGAQGNSSMGFAKKNISLKIYDTENVENAKGKWGKGDTFGTVFGDWVMQKSYHLKAYVTNFYRGEPVVAYELADRIVKSRGIDVDRPWKKALLGDYTFTDNSDSSASIDDISLQIDGGARCFPDGFPVIVYQQGEFYGIFSWQIKKDAANYHLEEDNPQHIHLDGKMDANFFNGIIDWTSFEIRVPEDLVCMDGSDYDGDHPQEIIDETAEGIYDSSNKNHVRSARVKQYIIELSTRCSEINSAVSNDERKNLIDTYFDKENIIDYIIHAQLTGNYDGFEKNWQWITYDGTRWFVNYYDLDGVFGCNFTGVFSEPASRTHTYDFKLGAVIDMYAMTKYVNSLYSQEIISRYAEIRKIVGISADYVIGLLQDWSSRIGEDNYDKEYAKWKNCECNRDNIINDGWELVPGEYWQRDSYNSNTTYKEGDTCWAGYRKFRATKEISGVYPYRQLGHRESLYRIYNWLKERFNLLDEYYHYNN